VPYAELEIALHRRAADSDDGGRLYDIELRLTLPDNDTDQRLARSSQPVGEADWSRWIELQTDDAAYGRLLGERFLCDVALRELLAQARGAAEALDVPLRLRLVIGPSAQELARLRWETLREPATDTLLLTSEKILFSRYVSSLDARRVRLQAEAGLRALIFIANPSDLVEKHKLAPVDVQGETERAKASLAESRINPVFLPEGSRATLNNLVARMRQGVDILYLVCHGAFRGESWLLLEAEDGTSERVPGSDLVTRIREMWQPPRLVVLASCESGDPSTMTSLGPRLAEAGVPAVLAMHGKVSQETVARFSPVFFAELQSHGQIDRAVAVARGAVREREDWWMPVLFMRLRSGRIWYVPGFGAQAFEKWPALVARIRDGLCTPILGPGLTDSLLGSRRELAQRLAETYGFPLALQQREDLPQVAQFLAVNQNDPRFPPRGVLQKLVEEMLNRHAEDLPAELRSVSPKQLSLEDLLQTFDRMLRELWLRRQEDETEPHRLLAGLPFRLYVTTNPDSLLAEALVAAGKRPEIEICRWNEDLALLSSIEDREPDYRPDSKLRPLLYHLFGRLDRPPTPDADDFNPLESLVLTEDDYFDFLIGATRNNSLIPRVVRRALSDSGLLFLGFQLDDWNFRVLFRSIMGQPGGERRKGYKHVAVQIDPEEGRVQEPERARRYLESYFRGADIDIYWGTVEDFFKELRAAYR
jgi:hypothetical protein